MGNQPGRFSTKLARAIETSEDAVSARVPHSVLVLASLTIGVVSTLVLTLTQRVRDRVVVEREVIYQSADPANYISCDERVEQPQTENAKADIGFAPEIPARSQTLAEPLLFLGKFGHLPIAEMGLSNWGATYLPDIGLRSLYFRLAPHFSWEWVEAEVGESIFLSGPHQGKMNFQSQDSFGHYNPKFFVALGEKLEPLLNSPTFVDATYPIFRSYLQRQVESYREAAEIIDGEAHGKTRRLGARYQKHLDKKSLPPMFLQEAWRVESDELERRGADWYESNTALAFWTRRHLDGSADEIKTLLDDVYQAYVRLPLLQESVEGEHVEVGYDEDPC